MVNYEQMEDEEVIRRYQQGDGEAMDYICQKYKGLVLRQARSMYLVGGETDDLIQEGMLGLFKAIRDFDGQKGVTFFHFAQLCVTRQIAKAVEASNRKKNQPLNSYVSIYAGDGEEGPTMEEMLAADSVANPEELLIDSENVRLIQQRLHKGLSPLERQVLDLHLQGYDYHAIARMLNRKEKGIDNALQRIRQKVKKLL